MNTHFLIEIPQEEKKEDFLYLPKIFQVEKNLIPNRRHIWRQFFVSEDWVTVIPTSNQEDNDTFFLLHPRADYSQRIVVTVYATSLQKMTFLIIEKELDSKVNQGLAVYQIQEIWPDGFTHLHMATQALSQTVEDCDLVDSWTAIRN